MADTITDLTVVVKPQYLYNRHNDKHFWLIAYSAGYVMYPDTTETSGFKEVTQAESNQDKERNLKAMRQLCREAKSKGVTRLIIYNFDGRDAKMHPFCGFVVVEKDEDGGTLYPQVADETRQKLVDAANAAHSDIVFLDVTDCVSGYNAALRSGNSFPEDVYVAAKLNEENKIESFVTRLMYAPWKIILTADSGTEDLFDYRVPEYKGKYTYCEHPADIDAQFSYNHLIGATVKYDKPQKTRSGRTIIKQAAIIPTLKGEADRRKDIEETAARQAAQEIKDIEVIYRYMPIPDWESATPEQYATIAKDATEFGANTLVAMHCASSLGRTGGMIQTVVAATSEEQFSQPSELAYEVNKFYKKRNGELTEFKRSENALAAAQSYRDNAQRKSFI